MPRLESVDEDLEHGGVAGDEGEEHRDRCGAAATAVLVDRAPAVDRVADGSRDDPQRRAPQHELEHEQRADCGHARQPDDKGSRADHLPQRVIAVRVIEAVERRAMAASELAADVEVVEGIVERHRERRRTPHDEHGKPHRAHDQRGDPQYPRRIVHVLHRLGEADLALASQHVLQQLARRVARQLLIRELDVGGHLEVGEGLGDPGRAPRASVSAAPGSTCTTALTSSPSSGWGTPITAASAIVGMLDEAVLDLDAVDVLAAPDDHVLGPVGDEEEAVVVDVADVAGVQPAVDRRSRRWPRACPSSPA